MGNEVTVTKSTFDSEVVKSDVPVLVDFWAEWCAPCKMIAPVLDQISGEYAGKLKVAKVDVDAEGDLAMQHNVVSIPTLLVFKGGQVVAQRVGAVPKAAIEELFKPHL